MSSRAPADPLERLKDYLHASRSDAHRVMHHLLAPGRSFLLRRELLDSFKLLCEAESIGRGVECLNRRLSSRLFDELGKGAQHLFQSSCGCTVTVTSS